MLSIMKSSWENFLFPFNPTLADEILFDVRTSKQLPTADEIMEEFRLNGQDFEYCPDTDAPKKIVPWRKKNKKPLPTECVFCKNNGEKESYYKKHLLKDVDGRILCPVLRAYTCPNCGASGDLAHTDKYCPNGPYNPNSKSITNAFKSTKTLRTNIGRSK
ncbi:nanos homolog 3-like [Solenopsis invicta]|uniref:nanos homolog 3-like n=1 Tax=Solenopsis invicta TaxID=13686 RepID=UPI00193E679C|nr:nanos homolog 3-like [Solenopsis invicta]